MVLNSTGIRRKFLLILIKPSHYGEDGYVIRWWRTTIPSNSLAAVYGIASDCAERKVLGPDVDIEIDVFDETNTRVDIAGLLKRFPTRAAPSIWLLRITLWSTYVTLTWSIERFFEC